MKAILSLLSVLKFAALPNSLAKAGIILLALAALLSNLQLFKQAVTCGHLPLGGDDVTRYGKRFEGLKKMLPPQGVVGYISDKKAKDIRFDVGAAEYYLTQYVLSPLIVDYSPEHTLVIGNFRGFTPSAEFFESKNLILLKDFGNGVMLFRRQE